jgi:TonB family protein
VGTFRRFVNLFRARAIERDLDDEIRFHLEERARRNLAAQMNPADAASRARVRFGSIDRAKRGMRLAHRPTTAETATITMCIGALTLATTMLWRAASHVYDLGPGVTSPVPVARLNPQYTVAARHAKIQGTVRVRCVVGKSGVCRDVTVVKSVDPSLGLDAAAVQALSAWRFTPAFVEGKPVASRVAVDFSFALR